MSNPFKEYGFAIVSNALSKETCSIISTYTLLHEKENYVGGDTLVSDSHHMYGDLLMNSIMLNIQPIVERVAETELYPTYSYFRVYRPGSFLRPHKDREACEISVTLALGNNYANTLEDIWPIYIDSVPVHLNTGDLVVYRGIDITHSRKMFDAEDGAYHSQAFLHYVDKHGPHAEWKYDKRESFKISKERGI